MPKADLNRSLEIYLREHMVPCPEVRVQVRNGMFRDIDVALPGLERFVVAWSAVVDAIGRLGFSSILGDITLVIKMPGQNRHYENGLTTINPWQHDSARDLSFLLAHEIGHGVWNRLSEPQRKGWCAGWQAIKHGLIPGARFVTRYAATSCVEDFAEVFSFVALAEPLEEINQDRWEALWEGARIASLPRLYEPSDGRITMRIRTAKVTGDGSKVGVFIPLPDDLAGQFPDLSPEDTSPPHVTLCYVGAVPKGRRDEFVAVVTQVLAAEPGPIRAGLGELDSFVSAAADGVRRVVFSRVRFSRDVATIRDRLKHALAQAGFESEDSYPLSYTPHATLAYLDGDDHYIGNVPEGDWSFSEVSIWGLPKEVQVPLGRYGSGTTFEAPPAVRRWASDLIAAWGPPVRR